MKEIAAQYNKVIAVGYSQGGLIWRAMIEEWDNHNVEMFISLASPQHGVYGGDILKFFSFLYSIFVSVGCMIIVENERSNQTGPSHRICILLPPATYGCYTT